MPPRFVPLGDQAALASFEDEATAARFAQTVSQAAPSWLVDVVPAYASVAVFFDPDRIDMLRAIDELSALAAAPVVPTVVSAGRSHIIPCCYAMGLDLARVAEHSGLSTEQIIRLHAETEYHVFAIGFCPGFPYLGYLPDALAGVGRLPAPRLRVEAGSVGLTGRQTGIYTEPRPGGWNIVGRVPLELVSVEDNYFPLRTGDRVRFQPIDATTFHQLQGQRLAVR